eukprot:CCRYP_018246-RA/>CCRYP_018246-RA protein AED:0.00 eAED:0.00 QI:92/1/1/1/1/1/3/1440/550
MCNPPPPTTSTLLKNSSSDAATKSDLVITKAELAKHNTPHSAWCAIHSTPRTNAAHSASASRGTNSHLVLDITKFASVHPGGDLILLSAGKDATVLFETYHPRGVPTMIIKKLQIGVMAENSFQDSFYSWNSEFYTTLKQRVVNRLEERGLSRRGSAEIWIKALFLIVGFWTCLYYMISSSSYGNALVASVGMGTFAAFVGTCIQHDGNHGAFAKSKLLNKMAGWTLDMIGASAFTWEIQHMLGHHPYTNVLDVVEEERKEKEREDSPLEEKDQESDPDVFSSFPLMRMHPLHPTSWYHKYQHLYAPPLFALMTLAKVFQQDFEVATSKRLYHIDANGRYGSVWNVVRFWTMKAITMVYMMGLPVFYHGWLKGVGLFVLGHLVCGELLATMFIVNHVIEGVSYGSKGSQKGLDTDTDNKENVVKPTTAMGDTPMEKTRKQATDARGHGESKDSTPVPFVPYNDWAAVQCQTSVNWSPGSWFWNHFSGGLSHQIEHHLFPSICHTNYYHIQDVVESTCAEYGVPYQCEPNLWVAYGKMIRHLKFLGRSKTA